MTVVVAATIISIFAVADWSWGSAVVGSSYASGSCGSSVVVPVFTVTAACVIFTG